ncbi:T9SS type A sorting domain-containing protein [Hymenobacter cyanobacteriorum]|nr:T9SS type A sorting domain-containing protein [Hymenobacter cyanobacteriorum]
MNRFALFLFFALGLSSLSNAQTAASWQAALANNSTTTSGTATVLATAIGDAGQVYVAGYITGQVGFGATVLAPGNSQDAFVARWEPNSGTWAWALGAGGTSSEQALGLAVSGNKLYVTGTTTNYAIAGDANGAYNVQFGTHPLPGTGTNYNNDLFVARITDPGTPPTDWDWAMQAGGTNEDQATSVAVSNGRIYVGGAVRNAAATGDANGTANVQFGTNPLAGRGTAINSDLFVARLTDAAAPTTWDWVLDGGGTEEDGVNALVVNGAALYLAGFTTNYAVAGDANGAANVQLGSLPLAGTGFGNNADVLVAKLTDATAQPAAWNWAMPAGGRSTDKATALALSGNRLYVAGASLNGTQTSAPNDPNGVADVQFGSQPLAGLSVSSSQDIFVARLTDTAAPTDWDWAQQAGGFYDEQASGVAVRGNAVYVVGFVRNYAFLNLPGGVANVRFGATYFPGSGTSGNPNNDSFVARVTDTAAGITPAWDWALTDNSFGDGKANAVAATATSLYVGGTSVGLTIFGNADGSPAGSSVYQNLTIASVADNGTAGGAWQKVRWARTFDGRASVTATAVGSAGQVYVAGYFNGQVRFGNIEIGCVGGTDVFVARWEPSSASWAWVAQGGGTAQDKALALAVSGNAVYVGGSVGNNIQAGAAGGSAGVQFGAYQLPGIGTGNGTDAFVARLTDPGSGAAPTWAWALQGGGTSLDQTNALAVNGGVVYAAGSTVNYVVAGDANGGHNVQFGTHPLPGIGVNGLDDVFVARITDSAAPNWDWAMQGGGLAADEANGLAVRGNTVYAVGAVDNSLRAGDPNGSSDVQFGTHPLPGIGGIGVTDIFVARLTDAGPAATPADWDWALQAGGESSDVANAVALNGSQVYVAGEVINRVFPNDANGGANVQFGTRPLPGSGVSNNGDVFVARFTDASPTGAAPTDWDWALEAGGSYEDNALGLALANGGVYVTGLTANYAISGDPNGFANVQFGALAHPGQGTVVNYDAFVARASDVPAGGTPTWAWLLSGGGSGNDQANALAVSGRNVYMGGMATPAATFGPTSFAAASGYQVAVLGVATDNTVLAVRPDASATNAASLYPNPAAHSTTLVGAAPRTAGKVFDLLGRVVMTFTTDATGAALLALPARAHGVYVVRTGNQALRLAIE